MGAIRKPSKFVRIGSVRVPRGIANINVEIPSLLPHVGLGFKTRYLRRLEDRAEKMRDILRRKIRAANSRGDRNAVHALLRLDEKVASKERLIAMELKGEIGKVALHAKGLTQLLDDRFFGNSVRRAIRAKSGVTTIVFLDLDKLKTINGKVSHEAGTATLTAFANAVIKVISKAGKLKTKSITGKPIEINAFAGRHGGDEIMVYLPKSPREGVAIIRKIADAFRDEFNRIPVQIRVNILKVLGNTPHFSAGISSINNPNLFTRERATPNQPNLSYTIEEAVTASRGYYRHLANRADEAAGSAKKRGKNRIVYIDEKGREFVYQMRR